MPVKFDEKSELKSADYFKSEQFEESDDDEICVFPPIQKHQKVDEKLE